MTYIADAYCPTAIALGSSFSVQYSTSMIELASGLTVTNQRWGSAGRRRYNLGYGIHKLANLDQAPTLAQIGISDLLQFIMAMEGSTHSFNFKDWIDYATTPTNTVHQPDDPSVTAFDQVFGQADDSTTIFQLIKTYENPVTAASNTTVRTINALVDQAAFPDASAIVIGEDDSPATIPSSDYSINYATGQITFNEAPGPSAVDANLIMPNGTNLSWGGEFWVVGRFGKVVDEGVEINLDNLLSGQVPDIEVIEDVAPNAINEDFPYRGAVNFGVITADQLISWNYAQYTASPATSGHKFILMDPTKLPTGGPYGHLKNNSATDTILVEDQSGNTITTLAINGGSSEVYIGVTVSGAKVYVV